jgi:hypothetical protein
LHPYCTQIFGINFPPSRIISTESRPCGNVGAVPLAQRSRTTQE